MSDITTTSRELAIRARVTMRDVAHRARDLVERTRDDERGQTAAEYMGVLLLVSLIIAALFTSSIGDWITNGVGDLVNDIANGNSDGANTGAGGEGEEGGG
jgi:Flp pilus assembly pilin Flp